MSNMTIKVEILAGTSITDAVLEAKQKCRAWDLSYITFDFNGVSVNVREDTNVAEAVKKFRVALLREQRQSRKPSEKP